MQLLAEIWPSLVSAFVSGVVGAALAAAIQNKRQKLPVMPCFWDGVYCGIAASVVTVIMMIWEKSIG